jgi:hypothetical protein
MNVFSVYCILSGACPYSVTGLARNPWNLQSVIYNFPVTCKLSAAMMKLNFLYFRSDIKLKQKGKIVSCCSKRRN